MKGLEIIERIIKHKLESSIPIGFISFIFAAIFKHESLSVYMTVCLSLTLWFVVIIVLMERIRYINRDLRIIHVVFPNIKDHDTCLPINIMYTKDGKLFTIIFRYGTEIPGVGENVEKIQIQFKELVDLPNLFTENEYFEVLGVMMELPTYKIIAKVNNNQLEVLI